MIRLISAEGKCYCLKQECDGILKIRPQFDNHPTATPDAQPDPPTSEDQSQPVNRETPSDVPPEDRDLQKTIVPIEVHQIEKDFNPDINKQKIDGLEPVKVPKLIEIPQIMEIPEVKELLEEDDREKIKIAPLQDIPHEEKVSVIPLPSVETPPVKEIELSGDQFQIDPSKLNSGVSADEKNHLFLALISDQYEDFNFSPKILIDLYSELYITLDSITDLYVEEPVQNVYYIGDLRGDFYTLQNLIQYFNPILSGYPSTKVVFLGNYTSFHEKDVYFMALLATFYLRYPGNVVLLRGKFDFANTLIESRFIARLNNIVGNIKEEGDEYSEDIETIQKLIVNIFDKMPIFHLGNLSNPKIKIFASNSNFPINVKSPTEIIDMGADLQFGNGPAIILEDLDEISGSVLGRSSDEIGDDLMENIYGEFKETNKFHYFLRSCSVLPDGVKYRFDGNYVSVFSAQSFQLPSQNEKTAFNGKIMRLVTGYSPIILSTSKADLLSDLEKSYVIDPNSSTVLD